MPVPAPPTPPMLKGKALGTWLNGGMVDTMSVKENLRFEDECNYENDIFIKV